MARMPPPRAIICETCGGKFLKSGYAQHIKKCAGNRALSHTKCPVCRLPISNDAYSAHVAECDNPAPRPRGKRPKKGAGGETKSSKDVVFTEFPDDPEAVTDGRRPCVVCGRKFIIDRLAKHQTVCKKATRALKRRRPFKSAADQRIEGTDFAAYKDMRTDVPWKSRWREQHARMQETAKALKGEVTTPTKGAGATTTSGEGDEEVKPWHRKRVAAEAARKRAAEEAAAATAEDRSVGSSGGSPSPETEMEGTSQEGKPSSSGVHRETTESLPSPSEEARASPQPETAPRTPPSKSKQKAASRGADGDAAGASPSVQAGLATSPIRVEPTPERGAAAAAGSSTAMPEEEIMGLGVGMMGLDHPGIISATEFDQDDDAPSDGATERKDDIPTPAKQRAHSADEDEEYSSDDETDSPVRRPQPLEAESGAGKDHGDEPEEEAYTPPATADAETTNVDGPLGGFAPDAKQPVKDSAEKPSSDAPGTASVPEPPAYIPILSVRPPPKEGATTSAAAGSPPRGSHGEQSRHPPASPVVSPQKPPEQRFGSLDAAVTTLEAQATAAAEAAAAAERAAGLVSPQLPQSAPRSVSPSVVADGQQPMKPPTLPSGKPGDIGSMASAVNVTTMATSLAVPVIRIGADVRVTADGRQGTVMYIGPVMGLPKGRWVGVAFPEAVGKNDGSVNGTRYFLCPPGHGSFVRARNLTLIGPAARAVNDNSRATLLFKEASQAAAITAQGASAAPSSDSDARDDSEAKEHKPECDSVPGQSEEGSAQQSGASPPAVSRAEKHEAKSTSPVESFPERLRSEVAAGGAGGAASPKGDTEPQRSAAKSSPIRSPAKAAASPGSSPERGDGGSASGTGTGRPRRRAARTRPNRPMGPQPAGLTINVGGSTPVPIEEYELYSAPVSASSLDIARSVAFLRDLHADGPVKSQPPPLPSLTGNVDAATAREAYKPLIRVAEKRARQYGSARALREGYAAPVRRPGRAARAADPRTPSAGVPAGRTAGGASRSASSGASGSRTGTRTSATSSRVSRQRERDAAGAGAPATPNPTSGGAGGSASNDEAVSLPRVSGASPTPSADAHSDMRRRAKRAGRGTSRNGERDDSSRAARTGGSVSSAEAHGARAASTPAVSDTTASRSSPSRGPKPANDRSGGAGAAIAAAAAAARREQAAKAAEAKAARAAEAKAAKAAEAKAAAKAKADAKMRAQEAAAKKAADAKAARKRAAAARRENAAPAAHAAGGRGGTGPAGKQLKRGGGSARGAGKGTRGAGKPSVEAVRDQRAAYFERLFKQQQEAAQAQVAV